MASEHDDGGVDTRQSAALLSALVEAEDTRLAEVANRHGLAVSEADLARVRDLLLEIAKLLHATDDERWSHLAAAYQAIVALDGDDDADAETLLPPPMVDPPAEVPPSTAPESSPESGPAGSRRRAETLLATPRADVAMPFQASPPNPETPNSKSLPPPALAAVIAGLPPMTVVSYAALCASCQAMPQRVAETHAKFGVTGDAARRSLDAAWQTKLAQDDRLHALWSALTEQFRTWLAEHR